MSYTGDDLEDFDIVLSCAKAHQLPRALATLKRLVAANTLLVTIQVLPSHLSWSIFVFSVGPERMPASRLPACLRGLEVAVCQRTFHKATM